MALNSVSPDDQYTATIQQGRAVVRLIEAIGVLLLVAAEPEASELRVLQPRYRQRLRAWVAELPPAISAQILMTSEPLHGPGDEVTLKDQGNERRRVEGEPHERRLICASTA